MIAPDRAKDAATVLTAPILIAIYIWLALVTGAVSFFVRPIKIQEAAYLQERIWASNYQFQPAKNSDDIVFKVNSTRILFPSLMTAVAKITSLPAAYAFSLLRLLSIFLAYILFHYYLRHWFSHTHSLLGTFLVAATVPITFNNYHELPTEFPELIVFTVGLTLIYQRSDILLAILIFVGTLNRETTAFLPLILLLNRFDKNAIWKCIPTVALAGFAWLIPLALLRYWKGIGIMGSYGDSISHNIAGLKIFFTNFNPFNNYLFYLYMFGPCWVLPFIKWKKQPLFFRKALLSLPAFIVIYLFFGGFLDEPREIINLYPILIPSSLFALIGTGDARD